MKKEALRTLTDIIYKELFGKNTLALLIYFKLPLQCLEDDDDDDLRNCMSIQALQAIMDIEDRFSREADQSSELGWKQAIEMTHFIANEVAVEAKAAAAGMGIDLLTGFAQN